MKDKSKKSTYSTTFGVDPADFWSGIGQFSGGTQGDNANRR